ncbi:MAG: hypothetical protein ACLQMF_06430 [Rectinemataceae bacterium]
MMECVLARMELGSGLALVLEGAGGDRGRFPTDRMAKALTLALDGEDLAEEGAGFGLPVVKGRFETVFPGGFRFHRSETDPGGLVLDFDMNMVERVSRRGGGRLERWALDWAQEFFAYLHRRLPFARSALILLSNLLRAGIGISTVFERRESLGTIRVEYGIDAGEGRIAVRVEADMPAIDGTMRIVLMNEAGAKRFRRYEDSDGAVLLGGRIETWRRIDAERASFRDTDARVFFSVRRTEGARLFRGRELVEGRLSWAGFAFVLPPGATRFEYEIETGVTA